MEILDTVREITKKEEDQDEFQQQAGSIIKQLTASPVEHLRLGRFGNTMARMAIQRDIPTLSAVPDENILLAEFVEGSSLRHKHGDFAEAKKRLSRFPDWQIDTSLSTDNALVMNKIGTREAVVAFRGTDPDGRIKSGIAKGMKEPWFWGGVLSGKENKFDFFKQAENTVQKAMNKYTVNELTGFSAGGTSAIKYGNKYGIKSTTFNPFLGANILSTKPNKNNKTLPHRIIRTSNDVATSGLALFKSKYNLVIDTIDPIRSGLSNLDSLDDLENIKTPTRGRDLINMVKQIESHGLHNFTEEGDRINMDEMIGKSVERAGNRAGDAEMIILANKSINEGKTFTEFVDTINADTDGNFSGNDTTWENGERVLSGSRMNKGSTFNQIWEAENKRLNRQSYTSSEKRFVDALGEKRTRTASTFTPEELQELRGKLTQTQSKAITEKYTAKIGEAMSPKLPQIKYSTNLTTNLIRNFTNVGRGVAGIAGSITGGQLGSASLASIGVELEHLQPEVRAMVEGASGGFATEGILSYLNGRSFIPKAQNLLRGAGGGAIGALVQEATSRGINELLKLTGIEENAGNVIAETLGGGIGGTVSVITAPVVSSLAGGFVNEIALMAGLEAIEMGAEFGSFGGLAGAVVGTVIGAGVAGGIALYQALQPHEDYVLLPDRQQVADLSIASDPVVMELMRNFNSTANFSPEKIEDVELAIEARAREMETEGVINMPNGITEYSFNANLTPVARGAMEGMKDKFNRSTSMVPADYPKDYINTGRHSAVEQRAIVAEHRQQTHTRDEKEYLQNLSQEERNIVYSIDDIIPVESLTNLNVAEILGYTIQDPDYEKILVEPIISRPKIETTFDAKEAYYADIQAQEQVIPAPPITIPLPQPRDSKEAYYYNQAGGVAIQP